jgi:hypothetical protein
MRPEPPHLTEAAAEWTVEENPLVVGNGIRMSRTPAFDTHGAEELLAITASVTRRPRLSAEDYAAMIDRRAASCTPP